MKTILTMIILVIAIPALAGQINLEKIAQIESSNNPHAYNRHSGATGLYQITKICLADYNQFNKIKFTMPEMFDAIKNKIVAEWYFEKRIPQLLKSRDAKITVDNILIAYNCGHTCIGKPLPKETINYIKKYNGEKL